MMSKSLEIFKRNISEARALSAVYAFCIGKVTIHPFDDLLRMQIAAAVSALDKFLHDLIISGSLEALNGKRPITAKLRSETISIALYKEMSEDFIRPKQYYFERHLTAKLKHFSFQDPEKIAEGLSYIWEEPQKWDKISHEMGLLDKSAKKTLKSIVDRRNLIVHESDYDPLNDTKHKISDAESNEVIDFIEKCGQCIARIAQ